MAYTKKTWVSGETPLSAENMNHIEQGVAAAHNDISSLNTKINKKPSHTMISMEISTLVIGSCPSATEHVITAELPTGYSSANSYVLGVRIERSDGAVVYMDDGKTGTTYLDNVNKINFAPTSFGITYCAGNRVSAIVCKVS